jgi:hypothetical protein
MRHVNIPTIRIPFAFPVKALALILVVATCISYGNTEPPKDDEDDLLTIPKVSDSGFSGPLLTKLIDIGNRAGFEIGNGRKLIKNEPGKYLMKIYDKWEVGQAEAFTEITSPLYEGVPRARLQINVVDSTNIQSLDDLYQSRRESSWIPVAMGKLQGVQQEKTLSSGVVEMEVRLFRAPGEVLVMQMDGRPGKKELTPFDKVISALTTFQGAP